MGFSFVLYGYTRSWRARVNSSGSSGSSCKTQVHATHASGSSKVILRSSTLEYCNAQYSSTGTIPIRSETVWMKSCRTVRHANYVEMAICSPKTHGSAHIWCFLTSASTLCSTRTPTMGNSASPGLGSSANHGLRDVGSAEPSWEVDSRLKFSNLIGSRRILIGSHRSNFQSRRNLTVLLIIFYYMIEVRFYHHYAA